MTAPSVTIVGPGRMGLALGAALVQTEAVGSLTVYGRRPEPPAHPLFTQGSARYVFGVEPLDPRTSALLLAVPDSVVSEMAFTIAAQGPAPVRCAAFHLSGALSTDVLGPLHSQGYSVGSFHPLQGVSHPVSAADRIPGSYVAVVGSPEATAVARDLIAGLGCHMISVPERNRPLYHAATVMASNYILPLLDLSARIMEQAGVSSEDALRSLLPLVEGTLASIEERGIGSTIRGPLARGDVETVALHLRALEPDDQRLYALFGAELLRLVGSGVEEEARAQLAELFGRYADVETTATGH